ncbi:hypothetical protein PY38_00095, partial [Staphylococcus aureus]
DVLFRRGGERGFVERAHARRVLRKVIVRIPEVDELHGGALDRVECLEAARQAERLVAHDARELLAGDGPRAGDVAQFLHDLDHRLLRLVGLYRRQHVERAWPARGGKCALHAVAPVLVQAQVPIEARGRDAT